MPPYAEVREAQLAALNEKLQEQGGKIKLVKLRAQDAEIASIQTLGDVVPLLLPHTAYKSYPESFLIEKKWDRLTKWLGTVSTYPTDNVDLSQVKEIDDWVDACAKAGWRARLWRAPGLNNAQEHVPRSGKTHAQQ